jgi:hypothetical protein
MTRASVRKLTKRGTKPSPAGVPKGRTGRTKVIQQATETGSGVIKERIKAVIGAAERSGLLREKSSRIGGRVSRALVSQAKQQTGIESDTDLIEFALASIALEDNFAKAFKESRGQVDPDLKLGF